MKLILTAILSAIIFCSCNSISGSGNIKTETRTVDNFDGVKTSGSIDVEVMNAGNQSVKIEADDNILPYIITTVEDGLFNVHYKSNTSFNNSHVKVYVSAPSIKRLIVAGSGSINSTSPLKENGQFDLEVSGSGDINADVDAPKVTADIGGSGSITLQGKTKDFTGTIEGSGDLKANKFLSENTTATVAGSGTAHVFASVHLAAKVAGSGDIFYSGNPSSPQIKTAGSGSVEAEK